jgi:hypothetical protein
MALCLMTIRKLLEMSGANNAACHDKRIRGIVARNIHEYGITGSPITGSRLVRAYCSTCGEPIRAEVTHNGYVVQPWTRVCSTCRAARHPGYNGNGVRADEDSPTWHNVVRCLEDSPEPMP